MHLISGAKFDLKLRNCSILNVFEYNRLMESAMVRIRPFTVLLLRILFASFSLSCYKQQVR